MMKELRGEAANLRARIEEYEYGMPVKRKAEGMYLVLQRLYNFLAVIGRMGCRIFLR